MPEVERRGRTARALLLTLFTLVGLLFSPDNAVARSSPAIGGELRFRLEREDARTPVYFCPLQRTDIDSEISGMFGRVRVRQVFVNPTDRKIEALYIFPLPENAAVDQMVMTVGKKRVLGVVKERQEARAVYEAAKAQGKVASLLDQERPNIFTQSVANIAPGATVVIEIGLVQTVPFADGVYTWSFPTVVGPRYIPGGNRVPDAARITPPIVPPTMRAGQTLGLTVHLSSGGLPLTDIRSEQHDIGIERNDIAPGKATVTLAAKNEIPNRDFILHYRIGGARIEDTLFLDPSGADADRYFSLLISPPRRVRANEVLPKEMVFVIDRSGSMSGFPMEKAKETMRQAILAMHPRDTFNLLSFSGGTGKCFDAPVRNTPRNRALALRYLADLYGFGGTEMLPAIQEALSGQPEEGRLRVVCFMTDGYIGDEGEILAAIRKHAGTARVFAFGIGSSVNRYLLDAMAHEGRGAVEYVTIDEGSDAAVARFRKRIQSPVLTDISLNFHGLAVYDVFPRRVPDLFDAAPLLVYGRIKGKTLPRGATVTLHGHTATGAFVREIPLAAKATGNPGSDALLSLWARSKVDNLLLSDPQSWQGEVTAVPQIKDAVIALGVRYNLMTPFTSFVAVEDTSYTGSDTPETIPVPVNLPQDVSEENAAGHAPVFATRRLYGVTGSMASKALADGTFSAQPGDPLIRITEAPADTRLIAAVLPDGTTIPLVKDPRTGAWEAHFDIPAAATEGAYDVKIYLLRANGERGKLVLHYRVDTTGALVAGNVHAEKNGTIYRLEIETDEEAARVVALLPNGDRAEMQRATASGTRYIARVPASTMVSGTSGETAPVVTFIVTDRAHNRTVITVDGAR